MGVRWAQPSIPTFAELIGESRSMRDVRRLIDQVAGTDSTVLVTGPSGSGKEVVAQRLHQRSPRAAKPFGPQWRVGGSRDAGHPGGGSVREASRSVRETHVEE